MQDIGIVQKVSVCIPRSFHLETLWSSLEWCKHTVAPRPEYLHASTQTTLVSNLGEQNKSDTSSLSTFEVVYFFAATSPIQKTIDNEILVIGWNSTYTQFVSTNVVAVELSKSI